MKTPFHTGHTGSRANRSTESILLLLEVVGRTCSDCVDDSDNNGDDEVDTCSDADVESSDPVSGLVSALSQMYDRARLPQWYKYGRL
jgi:hypothetical protein